MLRSRGAYGDYESRVDELCQRKFTTKGSRMIADWEFRFPGAQLPKMKNLPKDLDNNRFSAEQLTAVDLRDLPDHAEAVDEVKWVGANIMSLSPNLSTCPSKTSFGMLKWAVNDQKAFYAHYMKITGGQVEETEYERHIANHARRKRADILAFLDGLLSEGSEEFAAESPIPDVDPGLSGEIDDDASSPLASVFG